MALTERAIDHLLTRFRVGDGCWLWDGPPMIRGYAQLHSQGRNYIAHRAVYEALVGTIPAGLDLHHICGNRLCVRPGHLLPVTRREHLVNLTPTNPAYQLSRVTVCPKGHPYTEENTKRNPTTGARQCRRCCADREHERYERLRLNPEWRARQNAMQHQRRRAGRKS